MRILHLASTNLRGHYFRDLIVGQCEDGHEVLCGTLASEPVPQWASDRDVPYFTLCADSRRRYGRAAWMLARILRSQTVDVLHLHLFDAGIVGSIGTVLSNVPVTVIGRHHLGGNTLYGRRVHVETDRAMAKKAGRVMVASHAVRNHMRDVEGLRGVDIVVNNYGFDFDELRAQAHTAADVRREYSIPDSAPIVGIVGRVVPPKGHDVLVRAVGELKDEFEDVMVLVVGAGETEWIESVARELGVADRIIFAGYRPDATACIAACDVLAHPTRDEAFGQVLVEAMTVGTPTVASSVGGILEIIDHGETGLLVELENAHDLAGAIGSLLRDPGGASRMATEARQAVESRFPIELMVRRSVESYARWLSRPSDRRVVT